MMRNLGKIKRIVIKAGTNLLASKDGLDSERVEKIVSEIAYLVSKGYQVLLVSSGAVGLGLKAIEHNGPVTNDAMKQAAASIGQPLLMSAYKNAFSRHALLCSQILLTKSVLNSRTGFNNLRRTVSLLLALSVVPIFNENDVVSSAEIKAIDVFGDNDRLSAMIASKVDADLLILLTDIDGLYTANPKKDKNARRIKEIEEINEEVKKYADGKGSLYSTGGMKTKLTAAEIAGQGGCCTVIASGYEEDVIKRVVSGEDVGTLILPSKRINDKKRWLLNSGESGQIVVDNGAKDALLRHKSLLPSGIVEVKGTFEKNEVISVLSQDGRTFAKASPYFNSREIEKIMGKRSRDIVTILGNGRKDVVFRPEDIVFINE